MVTIVATSANSAPDVVVDTGWSLVCILLAIAHFYSGMHNMDETTTSDQNI